MRPTKRFRSMPGHSSDKALLPLIHVDARIIDPNDAENARVTSIRQRNGFISILHKFERWMDGKMKVEAMGVGQTPKDKHIPLITLIFSMILSPSLVQVGIQAPQSGLSVNVSIILSVFATLLGAMIPAFTATLCPSTDLRQIAIYRYAFGIWGARICGLLNIIVNVGFGVVGCIIGGQLLRAVSRGSLPLIIGIIIVVAISSTIAFLGIGVVHQYGAYTWLLVFILLCVEWAQSARYFAVLPEASLVTGRDFTASCLNYFAAVFSMTAAWCSLGGDFYVQNQPGLRRWLVFRLTHMAICIHSMFVLILGNFYGGIVATNKNLAETYLSGGVGALIIETMRPPGFAKFTATVFVVSIVGNVTAIIHSNALSMQPMGGYFIAVPRFFWCTVFGIIILALSWGGQDKLYLILENFLPLLGYWAICLGCILFIEDFYFRLRIGGYDPTAWQDPKRLPWGAAGVGALTIGIGFSFLGMAQTWYTGPIAKQIGTYGGDVGDYLSLISVCVSYPALRTLELQFVGR